jgi:hypothetical protein
MAEDLGDGPYVQTDGSWLIPYDLRTGSEPPPITR